MKGEVEAGIEELKRQFSPSPFTVREDGQGGAYVLIDGVSLSPRYGSISTWIGFQIPALYPYADIYPIFIGGEVKRADGKAFEPPVTLGHQFETRPAIQISRRNGSAGTTLQKATSKILKVLHFLENLP